MAHVPALDGLRGLAAVAILLFHGGYLTGGWLGVDLFFVLSGYLITTLLLLEHRGSGAIRLGAFWGRRARRLLPALIVLVVAVAAYAWIDVAAIDLSAVRSDGLATLFFVANWHDIVQGASYWDRGLAPSMFAHTWSLAVEEQLYLVWPLIVVATLRRSAARPAGRVARVALGAAAASAVLAIGLRATGASPERIYLGTDTRAVAVFLGAFVAGWRRTRSRSDAQARLLEGAAIPAAVVLALAWWGLDGTAAITYWGGLLVASALAALVVAAAADVRSTRLAAVLGLWPLRWLGLISYGLYLWHWPVYVVLSPRRTGLDGPALLGLRLAVTLVLSAGSWVLLERPIRSMRPAEWWTGRRGAAAATGAIAVAVAVLLVATSGAVAVSTEGLGDGVVRARDAPAGAPKIVVVGDSVAASIAAPAIKAPEAFGLEVVRTTVLGCQAVWDGVHQARGTEKDVSRPDACPPAIDALVAQERPDAVVVLYGGWTNADLRIDGRWAGACNPDYRALLRARFREVVADAGATGAPVFVANAPRSTNTFRQDDTWERTACTNKVMEDVARATSGVEVIDLDAWLCPGGACRTRVDGVPFRSDGVHFQGPGGAVASAWLFDEVVERAGLDRTERNTAPLTAEERATVTVCRGYLELTSLSGGKVEELVASAEARATFLAALLAINDDVLADLPPDLAQDLQALSDPAYQAWVGKALEQVAHGEPITPDGLAPGTLDRVARATERLGKVC